MFDFTRLLPPARRVTSAKAERPVDYTVLKDGVPFALLNAAPVLAARTLAGFAKAAPESAWQLECR
jgi:hypothetical protein